MLIPADHVAQWVKDALVPTGWSILRPEGDERRERFHQYHLSKDGRETVGPFDSPHEAVEWAKAND
jgi:hypothetical protein